MKNLKNPVKAFARYLGSVFILLLYSKLGFRGVETACTYLTYIKPSYRAGNGVKLTTESSFLIFTSLSEDEREWDFGQE